MTGQHDDIDPLIEELEKISNDPSDDEANRRFADTHAAQVAALLEELRGWRESADKKRQGGGRVIVEGYDEDSMEGAFADALNKAGHFFNEHHDISITVLGLVSLPRGGHRATLEIDITPLSFRLTEHPASLDVELKREHNRSFAKFRKEEDAHLKELVHEHFLETTGGAPHVPDYFLINFTDADLLNNMIEKQFFKAGHEDKKIPRPPQVKIRVIKPEKKR